jgi:anti-sigma regulatory factor (Ser/Thr protein kinase)
MAGDAARGPGHSGRTAAEVTVGQDPDAVRRTRRFVRTSLDGEPPELVAGAELVVTELVTNALLHGRPPVLVRLARSSEGVRVEVEDAGHSLPIELPCGPGAMTGRGMGVVAGASSAWGVVPGRDGGKVVWAELAAGGVPPRSSGGPSAAEVAKLEEMAAAWAGDAGPSATVRLAGIPTRLLVDAKSHIDNVVRELTLVQRDRLARQEPLPEELAELVRTVTVEFAPVRAEMKRAAAEAARRGEVMTDLELTVPVAAADAAGRYLRALEQADRYARSADLLTLAPPRSHRVFREWYLTAIIDQVRGGTPTDPFPTALVQVVDRLPRLESASVRLSVLQRVVSRVAAAGSARQIAAVVVDTLGRRSGVGSAAVHLLDGSLLRCVAASGGAGPPARDAALDAETPASIVARSGRPLSIRSLKLILDRFPALAGAMHRECSLQVVPLSSGGRVLGTFTLCVLGGDLSDDTEGAFASSVAGILALAMAGGGPPVS